MDISQQLERDHAELHALSRAVLSDGGDGDQAGRENAFAYLDQRVRRHLAVIEDVLVHPIGNQEHAQAANDILKEHEALRGQVSALKRQDKSSAEWGGELRRFTDHLERVCHQHERLIGLAQESEAELGQRYEEATLARIPGHMNWKKAGLGVAGAAALVGAAYVLSRYLRSGRREAPREDGDRD